MYQKKRAGPHWKTAHFQTKCIKNCGKNGNDISNNLPYQGILLGAAWRHAFHHLCSVDDEKAGILRDAYHRVSTFACQKKLAARLVRKQS